MEERKRKEEGGERSRREKEGVERRRGNEGRRIDEEEEEWNRDKK